jgi:hypothetical protein
MECQHTTCGIFYCRDSAKINGSGSLQTSSQVDSDVLRNRQQKHTAKTLAVIVGSPTTNMNRDKLTKTPLMVAKNNEM